NLAGALFFTYFLVVLPGVLSSEMWREAACNIAQAKVSLPWSTVFLRGVGANWLVCLAVWLGMSANDVPGRMLGLFFPIMCFVVIGYEHCIANMTLMDLALAVPHPAAVSLTGYAYNLFWATLGNLAGAVFFVSIPYGIAAKKV
ncbi:formate/nitrite transporter family protein, partial [uncultured Megasphaera sp.]|uniref:formate/nitrite transporter family protein n=1 Tax=uncultured Megasphaera sp. TaxID=165188 RepID=UPI0025FABEAC